MSRQCVRWEIKKPGMKTVARRKLFLSAETAKVGCLGHCLSCFILFLEGVLEMGCCGPFPPLSWAETTSEGEDKASEINGNIDSPVWQSLLKACRGIVY